MFIASVELPKRGAGIFPIDIDQSGFLCLAQTRRVVSRASLDIEPFRSEELRCHLCHQQLLCEVLATDDHALRDAPGGCVYEQHGKAQRKPSGRRTYSLLTPCSMLCKGHARAKYAD